MDLASVDGIVVPVAEASVSVTDDGLLRGDGVFEVIRLYRGVPFALDRHLEQIAASAENLRLPLDVAALTDDLAGLLGAAQPDDALLRLLATRGGRRIALIEPLPQLPQTLALSTVTYAPTRILDGVKSLSYAANMLASRIAHERGFDEALLLTPHGRVLELPTASFFWARGDELFTPPLSDHILDSITRSIAIECSRARERPTTLDDLASADEAFVASTVVEVRAVSRIDEHELRSDGELTRETAAKVRASIDSSLRND